MTKKELFEQLEKNLNDWQKSKEENKPMMGNFMFYCMCYMPLVDKLEKEELTEKEKEHLAELKKKHDEIEAMNYTPFPGEDMD